MPSTCSRREEGGGVREEGGREGEESMVVVVVDGVVTRRVEAASGVGAWQVGPGSGMWLSVSEGMAPERKDGSRRAPLTEVSICRSHFQNHEQS